MLKYSKQTRLLLAVDCIIFGFDGSFKAITDQGFGEGLDLMGWLCTEWRSLDPKAANPAILKQLTGLEGVYLEQLYTFGEPHRDPMGITVSVAYFALIDIQSMKHRSVPVIMPSGLA